jgi:hypothetical protein
MFSPTERTRIQATAIAQAKAEQSQRRVPRLLLERPAPSTQDQRDRAAA